MKYEAILENSRFFKVVDMCRVLGVTPQNYYRWRRDRIKAAEKRKRLHSYLGYMSPVEYRLKRYTEDCTGTYE